ncbi:MAG TPA: hypothetical protein PLI09_13635 [Candidatus Hydrogenedentes bacterium]|nr:hypothetical protein [Candidatus Hydrogenedentota bacterium]
MLLFSCPHCDEILKVPEEYLGRKGRCNKCGGRIALIGHAKVKGVQAASKVAEKLERGSDPPAPATEKQLQYLRTLGAPAQALEGIDREQASEWIDKLRAQRHGAEPPTDKQMAYLNRLGAPEKLVQQVRSKADASQLIEDMHLSPTPEQMTRLQKLGATGAQLALLKTKAGAASLMAELSEKAH